MGSRRRATLRRSRREPARCWPRTPRRCNAEIRGETHAEREAGLPQQHTLAPVRLPPERIALHTKRVWAFMSRVRASNASTINSLRFAAVAALANHAELRGRIRSAIACQSSSGTPVWATTTAGSSGRSAINSRNVQIASKSLPALMFKNTSAGWRLRSVGYRRRCTCDRRARGARTCPTRRGCSVRNARMRGGRVAAPEDDQVAAVGTSPSVQVISPTPCTPSPPALAIGWWECRSSAPARSASATATRWASVVVWPRP